MPVAQSERNLAGLLVHGGVGVGLVWFLDDQDATHNANPKKTPDWRRLTKQPRSRTTASVLPAADWSAMHRRFHGYRGHAPPLGAPRSVGQLDLITGADERTMSLRGAG